MSNASELINQLVAKGLKIVTAESCTGGLIAAAITAIPGSSKVFERGYITYSNEAKIEMLGVSKTLIEKHGAVSSEVAAAMAIGACRDSGEDVAISATGIAGPATSEHKPVGLVFIAICYQGKARVIENQISGNREEIQAETVSRAINLVLSTIKT